MNNLPKSIFKKISAVLTAICTPFSVSLPPVPKRFQETVLTKAEMEAADATCYAILAAANKKDTQPLVGVDFGAPAVAAHGGKFCRGCVVAKPRSEFYTDKKNPDGLDGLCKDCRKLKQRRYSYEKYWGGQRSFDQFLSEQGAK